MFHRQSIYGCHFHREKPHFQIGKKQQFHAAGNRKRRGKQKRQVYAKIIRVIPRIQTMCLVLQISRRTQQQLFYALPHPYVSSLKDFLSES